MVFVRESWTNTDDAIVQHNLCGVVDTIVIEMKILQTTTTDSGAFAKAAHIQSLQLLAQRLHRIGPSRRIGRLERFRFHDV